MAYKLDDTTLKESFERHAAETNAIHAISEELCLLRALIEKVANDNIDDPTKALKVLEAPLNVVMRAANRLEQLRVQHGELLSRDAAMMMLNRFLTILISTLDEEIGVDTRNRIIDRMQPTLTQQLLTNERDNDSSK